ncbi:MULTISPECIES: DUF485 domain-containing protein [Streptomyces]|uniref:DUF485 domain-containing protein n=1 Tax=Streptomyces TaxID=1883 RepID=UPI000F769C2B|nr:MULTISPECIES: DUF485 domain-containing protein [Streptomyces]RST02613.1 DUF485 domain-containing protein [Streptomyces sp. WAC07149]GLX21444.1 hypothetical protein Slala01_50880 [Streptomyces lavendulae subsp. lavendulae]GLX27961.1 hypothetical protein Slala02_37810 [Streptomyces lavendulae subsp. lavendulae]
MDKHEGRDAGTIRLDDPWYDALAVGWGEGADTVPAQAQAAAPVHGGRAAPGASEIYLEVQRSAAFQEVRGRYRRFVVPATAGFFLWYVAYVAAATAAPGFMARPVAGAVNVALLAGLGQFLSTFLLTWAYARHARLRRDRAALDLRWTVFEQERVQERAQVRAAAREQQERGRPRPSSVRGEGA